MSVAQPMGPTVAPQVTAPQPGPNPPQYQATQPGQVIIIQSPEALGPRVYENYASLTSKILGFVRIGIGILSVIFTVTTIIVDTSGRTWGPRTTSVLGSGIWCGIFFILAGSFGVAAAFQKTTCPIVTNMVVSIVSVSVFVVTHLIISAISLVMAHDRYGRYYGYYDRTGPDYAASLREVHQKGQTLMALFGVLIALGLAECVCDIWSSALCCKMVCCGYSPTVSAHQVRYVAGQPGQQVIYQNNPQSIVNPSLAPVGTYQFPAQGGPQAVGGDRKESPPPAYGEDTNEQKQALVNFVN